MKTKGLLKTLNFHKNTVRTIEAIPNYNLIASGSYDKTIRLWNIQSTIAILEENSAINKIKFIEAPGKLASSSEDNLIKLWDIETCVCASIFKGHTSHVYALAIIPELNLLASGSWDKSIMLWDYRSRENREILTGQNDWIFCLEYIENKSILCSGAKDGKIALWDMKMMKRIKEIQVGKKDYVRGIQFVKKLNMLAVICGKALKLWDFNEEAIYCENSVAHSDEIYDLIYVSEKDEVITAGKDNSIISWRFINNWE